MRVCENSKSQTSVRDITREKQSFGLGALGRLKKENKRKKQNSIKFLTMYLSSVAK